MVFWRNSTDFPEIKLAPEDDPLLREAIEEHQRHNEDLIRDWSFDAVQSWAFNQQTGRLQIETQGSGSLLADGQALGNFQLSTGVWQWAWHDPGVQEMLSIDACKVRDFGRRSSLPYLSTGAFRLPDRDSAFYLAAIAAKISGGTSVFPAESDDLIAFLLIRNLQRRPSVATPASERVDGTAVAADRKQPSSVAPLPVGVHSQPHEVIELRRLHRFFGTTRAVDDISFAVPRGKVFGYIGPNGAGKTTSMRILATLDVPTYGDAFVDGFSVINDPDRVRRRLGFMPDSFGTYTNVNCVEYLDFYARAYGLVGRQRQRSLQHVMDFTGLDKLAEKPITGLSKGMKQRLCLGRSMIHDPAVLILDEPAAGLDPRARIELREMIGQLAEGEGKTVLVSSHILTELAEMCDTVGIIERGQLLALGSVDEIRHQQQSHREVIVHVLDREEDLAEWLKQQDDILELQCAGRAIRFSHRGTRQAEADWLREMVEQGFPVAEFRSNNRSLEDVFMTVTKGLVQ